ncbi:hypothetical protein GCM10023187_49230 [Nibrella viscosa]|uniref:Transglycosylase SLT domain-containing protein n=1 Tax=Nibrella viscosa TaxID=1084524 RepID=A0ABP8KWF2_9BACT
MREEVVARRLVTALVKNSSLNSDFYLIRKRAAGFFPIIEPILAKHKIPSDFKYLPLVESALRGRAVSPKGAAGYWQLMPATARELGLTVNSSLDERRDLHKSTEAACRYLRYLYKHLGSWTLAAAAYNSGIGNLLTNIRRQQESDYYYLKLNAETGRYLYRVLAFKELFGNYKCYAPYLPQKVLAVLSKPVEDQVQDNNEDAILSDSFLQEATRSALAQKIDAPKGGNRTEDLPLPNAADVFRGGVKARLAEAGDLQPGQVWVFHLTRDGLADGKPVTTGDLLYAIVEDIDPQTGKLYLRAEKLYSLVDRATYNLALAAVDAATGRVGIKLPAVDQMKSGWILTWKVL